MNAIRRFSTTIGAAALFAIAAPSGAHWPLPSRVDVEIVDRTEGRVLPVYVHDGRRYVVGRPGNEYAVRVVNRSGERVLAVMSVDGVNVITGDTASTGQSGYVLSPGESSDIAGWRKSMQRTAAFYFTSLPNSYAARTGRPDNVGVIGVAVFQERSRPLLPPAVSNSAPEERSSSSRKDASEGAAAARAAPRREADADEAQAGGLAQLKPTDKLGTGHGRSEDSFATYTRFERASSTPSETIAIYYDSYENLLAQGVPVSSTVARVRPFPFPDRGRFAPDPR